ncbi:Sir2 family NAD-dependent protein deacetylase [Lichenihabitans sp. PAMC28606]|uniref:SIR2 family NAD-dependent protein deacylase n=1 Tax=Lichenihabitans sp. PAMC28606 TaxID=2880932 RepID=UPI001D0B9357|nr:Sir2 family NAD-dependent protein deacetylase [Lichenihabitans sp. PAMC28606]UDL95087.1 Sir2 family NAD-dependent protein deacetylase [Lichenihabitans sp. PAMC28606]
MTQTIGDARQAFAALLETAGRIVALTGAGISTECGVPDFRSPDSPWRRYPPIDFKDFCASPGARVEAWRRKFAMDDIYAGARPGRTHRALARLNAEGRLLAVLTQNIDGLHQAAGLPVDKLVELHGNGTYARCLACGARHELVDVRRDFEATHQAPTCSCGGMVKSATVAFGQSLDPDILRQARIAAEACDLFLVLGSSMVVQPAATLPLLARHTGAVLAIVNREPTRLDQSADLVIHDDVGTVLAAWAEAP